MSYISVSWTVLVLVLISLFEKTQLTTHDNSHGFVSPARESYFIDDLSNIHQDISPEFRSSIMSEIKMLVKFEPEFLDFKQRALGVPHLEKVMLFNVDGNKSIDMTSISGSTVHFHCSFFEDKQIPPLGNTSFNVVFLGREEGIVESNLFIHTTEGHFKYQVKGSSVSSPYRLRPIRNIKLPLNATFSPLIYIFNPHLEPIQIIEIYSSGGDFHLELPSGELEGPKDMWEIPPLQTKAVIRVRFYAKTEQNHTAYVRIKLNNSDEILVVPLEVEVTTSCDYLHSPQGFVDFGVGGSLDSHKKLEVVIANPLKKSVRIESVTSSSKAIKVEFNPVKIAADSLANIGSLTLNWKKAFETKDFFGKITIKYKNVKHPTEIPYYVTIMQGGLLYNRTETTFFIDDETVEQQSKGVTVKNDFLQPLAITEVELHSSAQKVFTVTNFKPIVLKPKEKQLLFQLNLVIRNKSDLKMNSHVVIKTNVSEVELTILCYNGKLDIFLPNKNGEKSLDLGLIGHNVAKDVQMLLLNNNPVDVHLKWIDTSLASGKVELLACGKGNYSYSLLQHLLQSKKKCTYLRNQEFAVLRLTVQSSSSEGRSWGDVQVVTQYEEISIPVMYKVARGRLEIGPDRLVFDQCFPGKICSHPLKVHSTFNDPMVIEEIVSIPPDPRISSIHSGHIMARSTKIIGHLYLDPVQACKNECYSTLQEDVYVLWLQSFNLTNSTPDTDLSLVNVLYNRYLNQTFNGLSKWQNLTMLLHTSEVKGHVFQTRVKMSWPSLLFSGQNNNVVDSSSMITVFDFPLTQVGNVSYRNITIRNPASHNLIVQLVIDSFYPNPEALYEGLPPSFIPNYVPEYSQSRPIFFFDEDLQKHRTKFQKLVDVDVFNETLPVLLRPGQNFTFTVGYAANETCPNTALMFIRNNLTVLEVIRLNGKAAQPNFKFGNRKPGSGQPLAFEITEKHLKDCERDKTKKYPPPNLTVKRSFTARNTGDVTIYINSFSINGYPCEGYGFKVLNCEPTVLPPNSTKKIYIAFTSDFSLAKVTRTLMLDTSLNYPVYYTLVTTVPPYYLSLCLKVLGRPSWESYLYYAAVCVATLTLLFVVVAPVLESERIIKLSLGVIVSRNNAALQPLDLRLVGAHMREEMLASKMDAQKIKDNSNKPGSKVVSDVHFVEEDNAAEREEAYRYQQMLLNAKKKKTKRSACNESAEKEPPDPENTKKSWLEIHGREAKLKQHDKKSKLMEPSDNNVETTPMIMGKAKKSPKENKSKWSFCKKSSHGKRKSLSSENVEQQPTETTFEEETSSTTTDSSNNDEHEKVEIEKDNTTCKETMKEYEQNVRTYKNSKKSTTPHLPRSVQKSENEHKTDKKRQKTIYRSKEKVERTSSDSLRVNFSFENSKHSYMDNNNASNNNKLMKGHKTSSKERKEKQALSKKLSAEKHRSSSEGGCPPRLTASPTMPFSNVWGENRATFSDVVARTDTVSPHIQQQQQQQQPRNNNSKPTMYVEPYVPVTSNLLGPIGSKKTERIQISNTNNTAPCSFQDQQQQYYNGYYNNNNNSFFSDLLNMGTEYNGNADSGMSRNWCNNGNNINGAYEQRNVSSLIGLMNSTAFTSLATQNNQGPWEAKKYTSTVVGGEVENKIIIKETKESEIEPKSNIYTDPWTSHSPPTSNVDNNVWDGVYMSLGNNAPIQQQNVNHQSGYLWGSSSVWQPLAAVESSRTSTRTPPGFPPNDDDRRNQVYDPFGLTSIWSQQQTNPWNYNESQ